MKPQLTKPTLIKKSGEEFMLSGNAFVELVQSGLKRGIPFRFEARGFSMFPFIRDGDVITVFPLTKKTLEQGYIVAFIHPSTGMIAVHRIIKKDDKYVSLKGDNIPEVDGLVPKDKILGYVKEIERNGKKIILSLGPERILVASLSRKNLFYPLTLLMCKVSAIMKRGQKHG